MSIQKRNITISAVILLTQGALLALAQLVLTGMAVLGLFAALTNVFSSSETIILSILTLAGLALLVAAAMAHLAAGWGLLKERSWARKLAIALAALHLLLVPLGTILGGFILYALLGRVPGTPDQDEPVETVIEPMEEADLTAEPVYPAR